MSAFGSCPRLRGSDLLGSRAKKKIIPRKATFLRRYKHRASTNALSPRRILSESGRRRVLCAFGTSRHRSGRHGRHERPENAKRKRRSRVPNADGTSVHDARSVVLGRSPLSRAFSVLAGVLRSPRILPEPVLEIVLLIITTYLLS